MSNQQGFRAILRALKQKPMLVTLLLGFSSGLPYLLASKTLQTWMSYTGGTTEVVSMMTLVGVPYSIKFLWSPLMDRYTLSKLGRRRSWLLATQLGLLILIAALSFLNPVQNIFMASILALGISFFSASQDIVIDAFRREILKDYELGLGSSLYSMGYRISNWTTGGLALILTKFITWNQVYLIMAAGMLIGIGITLWSEEPQAGEHTPQTLRDAVVLPLKEFFGRPSALLFLIFILLYKIGDGMAGNVLPKFYQELGFTAAEVGMIAKTFGIASVIVGTFVGGALLLRLRIGQALFIFGVLQAVSTLSFVALDMAGHNLIVFAGVIFFEDFSSGMGSAAFMAYMAMLTNKNFTATQYALLTSLMAIPSRVISAWAGHIVTALGWEMFFIFCALLALPGLLLIRTLSVKLQTHTAGE